MSPIELKWRILQRNWKLHFLSRFYHWTVVLSKLLCFWVSILSLKSGQWTMGLCRSVVLWPEVDNETRDWDVVFRASQDILKEKEMMRSHYREKAGWKKMELMSRMDGIFIVFCSKHFKWESKMIILKIAYLTLLVAICVSSVCSYYILISSPYLLCRINLISS